MESTVIETETLYEDKYISKKIYLFKGNVSLMVNVDCQKKAIKNIDIMPISISNDDILEELITEEAYKYFSNNNSFDNCDENKELSVDLITLSEYDNSKINSDIISYYGNFATFVFNYECGKKELTFKSRDGIIHDNILDLNEDTIVEN